MTRFRSSSNLAITRFVFPIPTLVHGCKRRIHSTLLRHLSSDRDSCGISRARRLFLFGCHMCASAIIDWIIFQSLSLEHSPAALFNLSLSYYPIELEAHSPLRSLAAILIQTHSFRSSNRAALDWLWDTPGCAGSRGNNECSARSGTRKQECLRSRLGEQDGCVFEN